MKIRNCLNCGATLDASGCCAYCGTHNVIDRELEIGSNDMIDILLVKQLPDGNIFYIPARGRVSSVTITHHPHSVISEEGTMRIAILEPAQVSFEFDGFICDRGD